MEEDQKKMINFEEAMQWTEEFIVKLRENGASPDNALAGFYICTAGLFREVKEQCGEEMANKIFQAPTAKTIWQLMTVYNRYMNLQMEKRFGKQG